MSLMRRFLMVIMVFVMMAVAGCRSPQPTYHIRSDIDFSFYKRVAVMPLKNLSNDQSAGEIVRDVVMSELLASGLADVVVAGEVDGAIEKLGIVSPTALSREQIKRMGDIMNVQALIIGSVDQYGTARTGQVSSPEVTITLLMADTGTGDIIWSITTTRGGASFMSSHFGTRSETMSETVLTVVREAIQTLAEY